MGIIKQDTNENASNGGNLHPLLGAGFISIEKEIPADDYDNQFQLLCYYPKGNDVGSNYKIVWTFNFKYEIGISHWMVLPIFRACT